MAGTSKEEFLRKWREMDPKRRMMIAGGSGLMVVIILGVSLGSPGTVGVKKDKPATTTTFNMAGGKDLSVEQIAAQLDAMRNTLADLRQSNDHLQTITAERNRTGGDGGAAINSDVTKQLRDMRLEMDQLRNKKTDIGDISLDDQLPPGSGANNFEPHQGNPGNVAQQVPSAPNDTPQPQRRLVSQEIEKPKMRVIGGDVQKPADTSDAEDVADQTVYLPSGSNFEGVLINGMDAPTNGAAKANPTPALMRLDTDAILPNKHRFDIRECFALLSGFGVMSTERAQLQTVRLSCVKEDGSVIETKLDGYVVGEDGKVGLRGRLVTKQGSVLARSFVTGFFSGIGSSLTAQAVPQLNVNPGATAQYQMPNVSQMLTTGTAQGVSTTAKSLSQFYLDMAKEMFPVVEIDAMRRATIILVTGAELSMKGSSK